MLSGITSLGGRYILREMAHISQGLFIHLLIKFNIHIEPLAMTDTYS
jgi:hypothetical protein